MKAARGLMLIVAVCFACCKSAYTLTNTSLNSTAGQKQSNTKSLLCVFTPVPHDKTNTLILLQLVPSEDDLSAEAEASEK